MGRIIENIEEINNYIEKCTNAKQILETQLDMMIKDFSFHHGYNPVEHIKGRIKAIDSIEEKLKRYRVYDGLEFGYVQGREAAFLLQNICPVTEKYIVEKYIDERTGKDVSIPNDLMRKIDAKAKKIMNKYYQGTRIVITDLDYIFEHL